MASELACMFVSTLLNNDFLLKAVASFVQGETPQALSRVYHRRAAGAIHTPTFQASALRHQHDASGFRCFLAVWWDGCRRCLWWLLVRVLFLLRVLLLLVCICWQPHHTCCLVPTETRRFNSARMMLLFYYHVSGRLDSVLPPTCLVCLAFVLQLVL